MDYKEILCEVEGQIRIITINKPKAANSISPLTSMEMEKAIDEYVANKDERVCIITAAGEKIFCAGNDMGFMMNNMDKMEELVNQLKYKFGGIVERFDCYKPIIAAVNGLALGGGFEIALAADIIIAADNAAFGLPEAKVGMAPMAGGMHRLPRMLPHQLAMEIMFTGRRIPAEEAKKYGFVNDVVPQDQLIDKAKEWAQEIIKCAPLSIQAIKEAVTKGMCVTLEEASKTTYPMTEAMLASPDLHEGGIAMIEKREPKWQG